MFLGKDKSVLFFLSAPRMRGLISEHAQSAHFQFSANQIEYEGLKVCELRTISMDLARGRLLGADKKKSGLSGPD